MVVLTVIKVTGVSLKSNLGTKSGEHEMPLVIRPETGTIQFYRIPSKF